MFYHAMLTLSGEEPWFWWNYSRDDMLAEVLIPFVSKQICDMPHPSIGSVLVNFSAGKSLAIAKTGRKISEAKEQQLHEDVFWKKNNCTSEFLNDIRIASASPSLRSLLEKVFSPTKDQVFVIMRFGDSALDSAYERVIEPVVDEFGLRAFRVDKVQDSLVITEQILDNIASSRLVVADLSGERPNCYYETGFAQALGKDLILLVRSGEHVHFDLQSNRFITWDTEKDLATKLRERLKAVVSLKQAITKQAITKQVAAAKQP